MIQNASSQSPFDWQDTFSVDGSNPVSHVTDAVELYVVLEETSKVMLPLEIGFVLPQSKTR